MTANHIHNIARGICSRDGSVLLAWHKEREYYFLPGGHIEQGESAAATLERECDEELGLAVTCGTFLLLFEHAWQNGDAVQHELTSIFAMTCNEDSPLQSRVAHLEFRWVPVTQISALHFLPLQLQQLVIDVAMGRPVPTFLSTMR